MGRRFNLRDLRTRTACPDAPPVWSRARYGEVMNKNDYHARLIVRVVPNFWKLWIDACFLALDAAKRRTVMRRRRPTELPPAYRRHPDTYYEFFGAKWVAEYIRWSYFVGHVTDVNDEYTAPNNCVSYWARLSVKENPEWDPYISFRRVALDHGRTAGLIAAGTLPTP